MVECGNGKSFILINIYLPYFSGDNYEEYLEYIGKINTIVAESETPEVIFFGDFNAGPGSPFFNEWESFW